MTTALRLAVVFLVLVAAASLGVSLAAAIFISIPGVDPSHVIVPFVESGMKRGFVVFMLSSSMAGVTAAYAFK